MTIEFSEEEMNDIFSLVADQVLSERLQNGLSITLADQNEVKEEVFRIIFKIIDGIKNALIPENILKEII